MLCLTSPSSWASVPARSRGVLWGKRNTLASAPVSATPTARSRPFGAVMAVEG